MRDPRSLIRFAPVALGMAVAVLGTGVYTAGAVADPDDPRVQFEAVGDAIGAPADDDTGFSDAELDADPAELAVLMPDLTAQGLTQAVNEAEIGYGNWAEPSDAAVVLRDPARPNDPTVTALFDRLGFVRGIGHLWLQGDGFDLTVEVNVFEFARVTSPAALSITMHGLAGRQGLETYETDLDRTTASAGMLQFGTDEVHAFQATAVRGHRLFRILALSGSSDPDPDTMLGIVSAMAVDE